MHEKSADTILPFELFDLEGDGYHLLSQAKIGGQIFKLVVDTGASRSVFDKTTLEELIGPEHITDSESLSTGLGVSDMPSYKAVIDAIEIGPMLLEHFEVAVLDLSSITLTYGRLMNDPVLGVLGCDFLVQKQAVIDFHKKLILLHKI